MKSIHTHYTHLHAQNITVAFWTFFLIFFKLLLLLLLQSTGSKLWRSYVWYFQHSFSLIFLFFTHPFYFQIELQLYKHPIVFSKRVKNAKNERKNRRFTYNIIVDFNDVDIAVDRWKSVKMHEKSIINYDCAWLYCRRRQQQQNETKCYESEQNALKIHIIVGKRWWRRKRRSNEEKMSVKSGFMMIFQRLNVMSIFAICGSIGYALRSIHTSA